jgi:protein N-terminal methyltransferase
MIDGPISVSEADLSHSRGIVELYIHERGLPTDSIADIACGIGRVSVALLSQYFRRIDLVEPVDRFAHKAESDLVAVGITVNKSVVMAQEWIPTRTYDAFWLQWAVLALTDSDSVALLIRCREALNENGVIFVKKNAVASDRRDDAVWDHLTRSLARTDSHLRALFTAAGLSVDTSDQPGIIDCIPVRFYVLRISET